MSSQRNPFDDLDRMLEQLRQQFGDLGQMEGALGTGGIPIDMEDRDDEFVVTADVPGCETAHLDVSVLEDTLRITAEYESATEDHDENYVRRERRRRNATRSIALPEPVDEQATTATCNNGILTVTLPKTDPEAGGRSIDIQ